MYLIYLIVKLFNKLKSNFLPLYYTRIAKIKLKILGYKYGHNLHVDGKLVISGVRNSLILGNNVKLISRYQSNLVGLVNPVTFQIIKDGTIYIGDNSGLSSVVISARKNVTIGINVKIGGNSRIYDHDYHSLNYLDRRPGGVDTAHTKSEEINIGNDVLIGTNVIILKGVNIGDRSIIGAGSVVSLKSIPSDSLVVGNPAKIIRRLDN